MCTLHGPQQPVPHLTLVSSLDPQIGQCVGSPSSVSEKTTTSSVSWQTASWPLQAPSRSLVPLDRQAALSRRPRTLPNPAKVCTKQMLPQTNAQSARFPQPSTADAPDRLLCDRNRSAT